MYHLKLVCFVLVSLTCVGLGFEVPSSWKFCKRNAGLNTCLAGAIEHTMALLAQGGSPEFKIPNIDPLLIPSMSVGEGTGSVHVRQNYKNAEVYGFATSKVTKFVEDIEHYKLYFETYSPYLTLVADYQVDGKVLILPVKGEGKCNITLSRVKATHTITGEGVIKDGKEYVRANDYKITLHPERAHFYFQNLFDGNKELGDSMNAVLNENWDIVFDDIKDGYEASFGIIFRDVTNKVFSQVPLDSLIPEEK